MQVRVFTLCDGAFNYNGKITIVGTIDNIKAPRFPHNADVSLAIKVSFHPSENGEKNISIKFMNEEGNMILPEMQTKTLVSAKGEEGHIVMVVDLHGLHLEKEGNYQVELSVNKDVVILPFRAIK